MNALLRGGIPFVIMNGIALILYSQGKYADAKGTFVASLIALLSVLQLLFIIEHWTLAKKRCPFYCNACNHLSDPVVKWLVSIHSVFDAFKVFLFLSLLGSFYGLYFSH